MLLVRSGDVWALPGGFVHERERLQEAVLRSLRAKASVTGLRPRQLHVFDEPDRDTRGWVLSVAHLDVVNYRRLGEPATKPLADGAWCAPVESLPMLKFDHDAIVRFAVDALRRDYSDKADPAELLDEPFTMSDLHHLHRTIGAGTPEQSDTFRRFMKKDRVVATGGFRSGVVGKPAPLYRRPPRLTATPD